MGDLVAPAATRTSGEPPGRGSFVVPSNTHPGLGWTVKWITDGVAWCPCPRFSHAGDCRHVAAVAQAIEAEARVLMETATPEQRQASAARLNEIAELFDR